MDSQCSAGYTDSMKNETPFGDESNAQTCSLLLCHVMLLLINTDDTVDN